MPIEVPYLPIHVERYFVLRGQVFICLENIVECLAEPVIDPFVQAVHDRLDVGIERLKEVYAVDLAVQASNGLVHQPAVQAVVLDEEHVAPGEWLA